MSLQIWLPLNGDLTQQGLSGIEVTNNGATVSNDGKIGKCYQFSNNAIYGDFSGINLMEQMSGSCWVYLTSLSGAQYFFHFGGQGSFPCKISLDYEGSIRSVINGTEYISGVTLTINTWYHLAVTFDGNIIKWYVNGEEKAFKTVTGTFSASNHFAIGSRTNSSAGTAFAYPLNNGRMNDVRIYNHCLSTKEVKIISQGLILHYPLNRQGLGQENLATNTYFSSSSIAGYLNSKAVQYNHSDWTSGGRFFSQYISSKLTFTEIKANQPYTISAWVYIYDDVVLSNPAGTSIFYRVYKTGDSPTYSYDISVTLANVTERNKWVRISNTFISQYTYTYNQGGTFQIGGYNGHFLVSMPKVELGNKATPWCPASTDALGITLGLNEQIEYDTSGYCNNGKYYAYDENGLIEYTTDTPRYNISTHIQSINTTTNTASGARYLYGYCELINPNQITITFWLKPINNGYGNSTNHGAFCTTNYTYGNINAGSDYQNSAMNHRDGSIDINDSNSTNQCRITCQPTLGEWHYYAYTYDGQVGRSYKDGVQIHTAQFDSPKTLDSFIGVIIGFSKAGGVWRKTDSYYSDFRVYATALSAEDIAELYSVGASIDNQGNIYSAMIQEV